jgi:hypothetical protein
MARRRAASDDASALARRRRGGQSSLPQGSTKGRRRVRPQGLGGYATVHETSTETTDSSTLILKYNTPKQQRWLVFGGFGRSPPPPVVLRVARWSFPGIWGSDLRVRGRRDDLTKTLLSLTLLLRLLTIQQHTWLSQGRGCLLAARLVQQWGREPREEYSSQPEQAAKAGGGAGRRSRISAEKVTCPKRLAFTLRDSFTSL